MKKNKPKMNLGAEINFCVVKGRRNNRRRVKGVRYSMEYELKKNKQKKKLAEQTLNCYRVSIGGFGL